MIHAAEIILVCLASCIRVNTRAQGGENILEYVKYSSAHTNV